MGRSIRGACSIWNCRSIRSPTVMRRWTSVAQLKCCLAPAHTEYGDRRNPTILFLHGIRLGRDIWAQHARMLVDRYHVLALDLPGHGSLQRVPFADATVGKLLDDTIAQHCAAPPLIVGY